MYALRSYYKYLRVKRIRTDDPTENLDIPRAQKRTPKYLTYDEMTRLKNTAQTPLKQAIIAMFYATGMRVSELVSLNKRQINWEAHRITIIGKGDKEREIPVSSTALTAVKRYLQTRNDNNPAVFVNSTGKCISKRTVQRYISEAGQAANIKRIPVSCHNLRHTYATHLLNKGIDINALKKWMGHSSINTTMIYAELLTETEDQLYTQSLPKGM
ncbi:MAG: tyrosine-type recombinase/integrase [Bacteroidales bacterium]|nr:tyrosine-type recombinase/integrase [Bacteroidales bacterium]